MNSLLSFALALAATLALAPLVPATEPGDAAPPLQIAEWVKGKPVDLAAAKGKQIVVVEFWATWCPPCRASIPHLTELQKKFKDEVVIVGVSTEDAPTVKKFVAKMGDKMDYTVAADDAVKTLAAYMGEFGDKAPIPYAFIVDKQGIVVWSGSPLAGLDELLAEVVAGKYNLEKAKRRMATRKQLEQFIELVASGGDEAKIDQLGKELEALDQELGGIEPGKKFNAAEVRKNIKFQATLRDYQMVVTSGKGATNLVVLEKQLGELAPKDFKLAEFKDAMTASRTFSEYHQAITGRGDAEKIPELAKKLAETKIKNARVLDEWAWTILADEHVKVRDLDLAAKLAQAAVDASEGKEPSPLDTYARALFETGKISAAISTEQKAIAVAKNDEMRKQLETTLKKYQEQAAAK